MARNKDMRRVLITRFSALGDVALSIGPVYSVCRSYPDCRFFYLTRKSAAGMFVNPPENLKVIGIDTESYPGLIGMKRLQTKLQERHKIDCVVDIHDVIRTKLLRFFFFMDGAGVCHIHKERRRRKGLTRRDDKVMAPLRHVEDLYRDTFGRAGFSYDDCFTTIFENDAFAEHYRRKRKDGIVRVAVAPFAKHKGKIYPTDRMERVVAALAGRENYKVFLFGSKADEREWSLMSSWAEKYESVSASESGGSMKMQLACLASCDLMLTMDSANMHLASLVGLRAVSIWGATHPYCGFYGRGQDESDAVQIDLACRPCSIFGNRDCYKGSYECMGGISEDMILAAVDRALSDKGAK